MRALLMTVAVCGVLTIGTKCFATHQQDPVTGHEIVRLLEIVRNERLRIEDPDKVGAAIATLGELRAKEAVDDLVRLITFKRILPWESEDPKRPISEFHTMTRAGRYPAVGSLFEIGEPSLPSLVKLISDYDSKSLESENALTAVMLIFRASPHAGVQYLKDSVEKSKTPLERQRLQYAAERAKGPPF